MDSRLKDVVKKLKLIEKAKDSKQTPKLKAATKKLINAIEKGDMQKAQEISDLHKIIGGDFDNKYNMNQEYAEDEEYTKKLTGKSSYQLFDDIWHEYWRYR